MLFSKGHGYVNIFKGANIRRKLHRNRSKYIPNKVTKWLKPFARQKLSEAFMVSGPAVSVLACAPQGTPATFSPGTRKMKLVS